jgi:hypothetical protein
MGKLEDELAKDERLWQRWCEEGVTERTTLAADVFFYSSSKEVAEQIVYGFRRWGLTKVEIKPTRTLWIVKGWDITGVETGTWSVQKMQDRSRRYVRLAEIWSATYEGCGAEMPDNESFS